MKDILDQAEKDLRDVGAWDNELQAVPAGGVRRLIERLREAQENTVGLPTSPGKVDLHVEDKATWPNEG